MAKINSFFTVLFATKYLVSAQESLPGSTTALVSSDEAPSTTPSPSSSSLSEEGIFGGPICASNAELCFSVADRGFGCISLIPGYDPDAELFDMVPPVSDYAAPELASYTSCYCNEEFMSSQTECMWHGATRCDEENGLTDHETASMMMSGFNNAATQICGAENVPVSKLLS